MAKKVLILTADAGFGHRSAAKAITEALQNQTRIDIEVSVTNIIDDPSVPEVLKKSQRDYDKTVLETPKFYEFTYDKSDKPIPTSIAQVGISAMLYTSFSKAMKNFNPDAIINTYPLFHAPAQTWYMLNEGLNPRDEIKKETRALSAEIHEKRKTKTTVLQKSTHHVPFITCITDLYSVHMLWYSLMTDCYCVASDAIRKEAISYGIDPRRVVCTGIPVSEVFANEKRSKAEIKASYHLDPDLPLFLAIGSKRVSNLMEYLSVLNHSGFPIQLCMAAGGDDELYQSMIRNNWHIPVKIYNFCDCVTDLMMASDLIISKAGGLITSESLAAGLPMLLTDVLPGQETGNAKLVETNEAGKALTSQYEMLELLCHMLINDKQLLNQMHENAKKMGKPNASFDIANIVVDQILKNSEPTQDSSTLTEQSKRRQNHANV